MSVRAARRIALALGAVVLLGLGVVLAVARARAGRSLEALLEVTGIEVRQPEVAQAARSEPDPVRARLLVARALVAEATDQSGFSKLPLRDAVEAASRVGERLVLAEGLASGAMVARPASWQACMLLGAARYLAWSRSGDARLVTERAAWERPLEDAVRRAPAEAEPLQLLALTRLELWPALAEADRPAAREVVRRAFVHEQVFRRLLPSWLAVASGREEVASVLPDRTWAWQAVAAAMAARADWVGFVAARKEADARALAECRELLDEGTRRLAGGDVSGARGLLLRVVSTAPRDRIGAGLVARAVELLPGGGAAGGAWSAFLPWVRVSMDRAVYGERGLPEPVVARMMSAAESLPAPEEALARLAAGELGRAETLERRAEDRNREVWAPYLVAKARVLAGRGDLPGARAALAAVHRTWGSRPAMASARVEVALRGGDAAELEAARSELLGLAAVSWPATSWLWRGGEARLDVLLARAGAVVVAVDEAPAQGGVVSVALDDSPTQVLVARAGEPLRLAGTLVEGHHVIALTSLVGGRVFPGEVTLEPGRR